MSYSPIPYSHPRRNGSISGSSSLPSSNNVRGSGSSQSTRSSTNTTVNPFNSSHMESTVTRLLVATKQLLESLTDWSHGRIDETGVSDIYVRLGNEFNAASLAFTKEGINMSDLNSVPDDLRVCLEAALSEEASPTTLDQHLPQIRQIVVHLLQGLKVKQAKWRSIRRQLELDASLSNRPTSSRDYGPPPDRPPLPHPSIRSGPRSLTGPRSREDLRRVAVSSTSSTSDHHRSELNQAHHSGSSALSLSRSIGPSDDTSGAKNNDPFSSHTKSSQDTSSIGSSYSKSRLSPVSRAVRSVNDFSDRLRGIKLSPPPAPPPPPIPPQHHQIPSQHHLQSSVRPSRHNDDTPLPPLPHSPRSETSNLAQASSLEALRKADMLQRRASKRFSTYTYNKIAATASPHKRTGENQTNLGLGVNVPALPRSPNGLTLLINSSREDLNSSARETGEAGRELLRGSSSHRSQDSALDQSGSRSRSASHVTEISSDPAKDGISAIAEESEQSICINPSTSPTPPHSKKHIEPSTTNPSEQPCIVFLQLGRDVKKATLDSPPTIASLRVLFMDRFQFNPGSDNFPEIYLRDPQSGIQYQLEDLTEIKDRVVLSLNIDALDQVKTHIDSGLSTLAREIKDLKSSITSLRRQSLPPSIANVTLSKASSPSASIQLVPDGQFNQISRQAMKRVGTLSPSNEKLSSPGSPQPPNSASSSSNLKLQQLNGTFRTQYSEIQSLRRDLGILRQLYGTFTGETKSMLSELRSQTESVKQAATAKVGTSRTFINAGKLKLESQSQDLVTKVESLQDTVEDLKQDVTNRKMKPKPSTMSTVSQSIQTVKLELEQLTNHISTIKPAWKKSWEDELQNIVDEQQLLNYQEDLIKDLKEDLEAVSNLFGHVEDYLDARKVSKVKPKEFSPSFMNSVGGGLGGSGMISNNPREGLETVLMQVKGLELNQESRLKAIETAEKLREKNLKEGIKENDFAIELAGFVGNKKLKMTGGLEEIERLRKFKSEQTLKALIIGAPDNNATTTDNNDNNVTHLKRSLSTNDQSYQKDGTSDDTSSHNDQPASAIVNGPSDQTPEIPIGSSTDNNNNNLDATSSDLPQENEVDNAEDHAPNDENNPTPLDQHQQPSKENIDSDSNPDHHKSDDNLVDSIT